MSTRSRSRNAYQSALNGGITAASTSFSVDSGSGLSHPVYLVIDPASPTKREYIKVGNVSGNTLSSVTRGLAGSAAGAQDHDTGTPVRAVPVAQWLDDIFDDIEDLEAADTAHFGSGGSSHALAVAAGAAGFLSGSDKTKLDALSTANQVTNGNSHDHAGGDGAQIAHSGLSGLTTGDPHTQYLKEEASGGTAAEVPDHTHASGAQAGTVAHSDLTGLTSGNPHTQYLQRSGAAAMTGNLDMGGFDITNLDDITCDVLTVATLSLTAFMAHGSTTAGATNMSTSEQTKATINLTIPAHWTEYVVYVWGKVDWIDNGASGGANATARCKVGGTEVGASQFECDPTNVFDHNSVPVGGVALAQTATGSIAVTLTTQLSAENLLYNSRNIVLFAQAIRTA